MLEGWGENNGATAIVDHGANPGLVSHFTKRALTDIAKKILIENLRTREGRLLKRRWKNADFAKLAQLEGVKTIHISERDTQITSRPKEVNEFVNTWSIEGFYEEGIARPSLGGTHESTFPGKPSSTRAARKIRSVFLPLGMKTWVRSWVPCGEITGMVVRHGEAFSISDRLTVWEGGEAVYRPTVHYAYCPSDSAINSLHELRCGSLSFRKSREY